MRRKVPSRIIPIDEESFFAELTDRTDPKQVDTARRLLDWCKRERLAIVCHKGRRNSTLSPMLDGPSGRFRLFSIWTTGRVELAAGIISAKPPFDDEVARGELDHRLHDLPGLMRTVSGVKGYPCIPLAELAEKGAYDRLIDFLEWVVGRVRQPA